MSRTKGDCGGIKLFTVKKPKATTKTGSKKSATKKK